jgi:amino acid adenylation domain-containing protein
MSPLLQHGVSRRAAGRPEATAVVDGGVGMTYGELDALSNQLARLIRDAGCARGDRVALVVPKSHDAIVGMLGTLKADCTYVPVDTSIPAARAAKIVSRSGAALVLASGPVSALVRDLLASPVLTTPPRVGWLGPAAADGEFEVEFGRADLAGYSPEPRECQNGSGDAAHILFTSGSTGEPKGVVITHANVLAFLAWAIPFFGIGPSDRNSSHPPLHFDLSTFDVYGTLAAGAELHLVNPSLSLLPHKLAAFIRESALTQWFSVPSILTYMAKFDAVRERDFPCLRRLLWCGEVFPTPPLVYWMQKLPHVTFTNLYGPTEATIASSYYTIPEVPDPEAAVPIGRPCQGEDLLVLDEALAPVPPGEIGDLYISGVGLSPGYWQDPEKTAHAFLDVPAGEGPPRRIYKTGDLARVGPDGLVYYLGRADTQIKSRGYRIELGEIEAALNAVGALVEVAVVGARSDGFEGTAICCAFVAAPGSETSPVVLRRHLGGTLPAYMLPSRWLRLDALPKNQNGKIDRRQLKELFEQGAGHAA